MSKKIYRIIFVLISIIALVLCIYPVKENRMQLFLFFTIQSNIICLIYMLIHIFKEKESLIIKSMISMAIIVTMLIYNFLLIGQMNIDSFSLSNTLLHTVCPIMFIFDYVLFTEKGKLKWYYPLTNIIIPYIYYFISIVIAKRGYVYRGFGIESNYPYFFMDVNILGIKTVIIYIVVLTLFFISLGYAIYGADRLLCVIENKYKKHYK